MRTTNNMMFHRVQDRIARVEEMRADFLRQISSGKKIFQPSDDPVGVAKTMNYSSEKVRISQFGRNMTEASSWLTATDHAMNEAVDVFMRADTLLLKAGNDTLNDDNLKALAGELEKMAESLVALANTNNAGSYIFGGHRTRTSPYRMLESGYGALYEGDDGQRQVEIGVNQEMAVNAVGGGYSLDGREVAGFFRAGELTDADARDAFHLLAVTAAELRSAASRSYRTAGAVDQPVGAELTAVDDLAVVVPAADGSGEKTVVVDQLHSGGGTAAEMAANNAWSLNASMDAAVASGDLTAEEVVTARLHTMVTGSEVGDPGGGQTLAAGDLTINEVAIGPITLQQVLGGEETAALGNIREIASRINARSEDTGVWATYAASGSGYRLTLTNLDAGDGEISRPITVKVTAAAASLTGLGEVAGAGPETTVYYSGAAGDEVNAAPPGAEDHTYYNRNNGTVTLAGAVGFTLEEGHAGVLHAALGLDVNQGANGHQASTLVSQRLGEVQRYLAHFESQLATVGARMNHVERSVSTYEQRQIDLQSFIADINEVDITAAIMNYNSAQNAYDATLAASARIFSTTILDYLR